MRALEGGRLSIACRVVVNDSPIGASVAVNGTCLTVVERDDDHLAFDLSDETVARTSLRRLVAGHAVNLERPVSLAARLGGHIVQGHVDGVGTLIAIEPGADGGAVLADRRPGGSPALRRPQGLDHGRRREPHSGGST